ncbi:uncharacterized protein TRUGW13939_06779 [Talaromyces rugulosus]|uniref:FAD-binding domain-containing protein n=1 Tax=Talaromyces rugulosus TaxID=121627 RepID=A0A7H8QZY2_TALRU|nr:uncharacterized protein TRUGW13939_06779 [Talaromyces rugulosus]QKX59642.1 hypothetical protein TRUGW13939_06779 [Talaromyces rugulosus]
MMGLLLARYGLSDQSLLCIDSKSSALKSGQADGIQPRTLEVFKTLGISDEIENEACHMWEFAFWNTSQDKLKIIERKSVMPEVMAPARFPYEATIHQGRIERIMETDLSRYSKRAIVRNTKLLNVRLDEEGDPEFPVIAEIETSGVKQTIRSKALVGADGAHSTVRQNLGLELQGQSLDYIWGVVDMVVDTNFPDIRRRCAIHSPSGSVMVIPRERIITGEYLTRIYVHVPDAIKTGCDKAGTDSNSEEIQTGDARLRRRKVTLENILQQARDVFRPYHFEPKGDDTVDWWAAYQIGQRLSPEFAVRDSQGIDRVFIVGDACHTHSPKAGQGMNVSMMDSYNLAWKLAYWINGLSPISSNSGKPDSLLQTYQIERHSNAQQLIDFDRQFSTVFSGQFNEEEASISHADFVELFNTGNGFTSGCGVEYPSNLLVLKDFPGGDCFNPVQGTNYLAGILRPGRRLLNVKLKRFADGWQRDIQDDLPSTGRFCILALASSDLLDPESISATTLNKVFDITQQFPANTVEEIIIYPNLRQPFSWEDIPARVKVHAEMRFYNGYDLDDAYKIYGVDPSQGALVVVRPDGFMRQGQ